MVKVSAEEMAARKKAEFMNLVRKERSKTVSKREEGEEN